MQLLHIIASSIWIVLTLLVWLRALHVTSFDVARLPIRSGMWIVAAVAFVSGIALLSGALPSRAAIFTTLAGGVILVKGFLFSIALSLQTILSWKLLPASGLLGPSTEEDPDLRKFMTSLNSGMLGMLLIVLVLAGAAAFVA